MTENQNESAEQQPEVAEPAAPVVEDTALPAEPVEVAPDTSKQAQPIDAGPDEVPAVDSDDAEDVPFALSRETADGSGFEDDAEADELESDFEGFAEDDVEGDDDEEQA